MKNPNAVRLGRLGGSVASEAQKSAARANGKLGGRPRGRTLSEVMTYKTAEIMRVAKDNRVIWTVAFDGDRAHDAFETRSRAKAFATANGVKKISYTRETV